MGEEKNKVDVELTHDIEVMTTPVTQYRWAEIMGEQSFSILTSGEGSEVTLDVKGRPIIMRPDHPVEQGHLVGRP